MRTPTKLTEQFQMFLDRGLRQGIPCGTCGKMAKAFWETTETGELVVFYSCHGQRDIRVLTIAEVAKDPHTAVSYIMARVFVPLVRVWRHGGMSAEARRERRILCRR